MNGSALHHKICHVLGGAYNLPHAQTHAIVLPYVLAFNGPAAAEAILPAVPPNNPARSLPKTWNACSAPPGQAPTRRKASRIFIPT